MENILLKKSFQDIYGNIYALYEYIIVWCSIQKICKYISKNTVNLELIRGAMDCWRDEKKKKNRRMLVLEWKVWHPLRYLLTVVFMNKRSEAKRSLKLHFERHPLLFSSWPFLAWIFGMREEDRRGHVCVFTLERQEEERTGGEGKWKKKKERRIRKEIAKDASLFDPLGTYSLERVALCRLYTVTPLFSHTVPMLIHFASLQYAFLPPPPAVPLPLLACALVLVFFESFSILVFCETTDRFNGILFVFQHQCNPFLS